MKRSFSPTLLAVFAAVLAAPGFAAGPLLDKDLDVPRATRIAVDIVWEKCTLIVVETHNAPDDMMAENAKKNDPKDLTFLLLRFRYANSDWVDHRVRLTAVLLSGEGNVVGDASHTATMDKGQKDDTISFAMKIKTADWPEAKKLRVTASFLK